MKTYWAEGSKASTANFVFDATPLKFFLSSRVKPVIHFNLQTKGCSHTIETLF